jgi:hypothetical protein
LEEWFNHCPPKKGKEHWVDGRSAKEMAKFWLDDKKVCDFQSFIRQKIKDFDCDYAIPEYKSQFDSYGSPRQLNLRKLFQN